MNETVSLWIVGEFLVLAGIIIGCYVSLTNRLTRLETINEITGHKAAEILHSSITPDLDKLIEKYNHPKATLTVAEKADLLARLHAIVADETLSKGERMLAATIITSSPHADLHAENTPLPTGNGKDKL